MIYNTKIDKQHNNLDLNEIASGAYIVRIIDANNTIKEFKVTKN